MGKKILIYDENNLIPYYFSSADVTVKDIYEAMYFVREYGEEYSVEILSDEFENWLLKVCRKAVRGGTKTDFVIRCFNNYGYLNEEEIKAIRKCLGAKESFGKASAFKEKGDMYYKKGDYINACGAYFASFNIEETAEILNNIGLCMIALDDVKTGLASIEQGAYMQPQNENIAYNLAKAYVLCKEYTKALNILSDRESRDCRYLRAEINILVGEMQTAVEILNSLYKEKSEEKILYKLCDIYIETREFEKVSKILEKTDDSIEKTLALSRMYAEKMDFNSATKEIEKNLMKYKDNKELWLNLSKYYRKKGNYVRSEGAVCKAFTLERESIEVALEYAKIKYYSGKYQEYKTRIENILNDLKVKYREKEKFFIENI